MKKTYILLISLLVGLFVQSVTINAQTVTPIGQDLQTVPADWQNDLWLNSYFRELHVGNTYQITARRIPEIIDNAISNNVVLPTFHYTVVRGNSVSVSESGLITANALGTSIVEVKYDEKTANGTTYGAVSPVNITYVAISVVAPETQNAIGITTDIKATHYDKQYFFGSGIDYSFTATATGATSLTVKCNDADAKKAGNIYTVRLKNRANIIEVTAKNGTIERTFYYVVNARKVELELKNITDATRKTLIADDQVQISFKGITLPVPKLATIYNPQMEMPAWNASAAKVVFDNVRQGGEIKTNVEISQWDLASKNTIELTLPESGEYRFTGGRIAESWWGSPLGTELDMTGPGQPNLNAATESGVFSALPAFRIFVAPNAIAATDVTLDLTSPTTPVNFTYNEKQVWNETYNATAYPYIVSQDFSFSHLPSKNSWGGASWEGFTVSKSTDNAVNHNDFPSRQWGCMAKGGVAGEATPYLVAFHSEFMETATTHSNEVLFKNNANYSPQGMFVCNTAYTTKCIEDGFFGARSFVQDDSYTLTAYALNADKTPTGKTAVFYLADYTAAKPQDRILNNRWEWFDLTSLGECAGFYCKVKSTDAGQWGDNTADYFAMDKLIISPVGSVNVNSMQQESRLLLLPNPATDYIALNTDGRVEIYSTSGMKVYENASYIANMQINVSHLERGVYFVKVNNRTIKFVKQ